MSSLVAVFVVASGAHAQSADSPEYPNLTYTPGEVWQIISPDMGSVKQLQPEAVGGYVVLAGNGRHQVWDIEDPYDPVLVSTFDSEHHDGEAEAHNNTVLSRDGRMLFATLSGRGVDLWDLTDPSVPVSLAHVHVDGIDYGDNAEAVWGLSWQGDALYVGGTNTGIHVIDTSDLAHPEVVIRVPTSAYGGISAGPLWAVGNVLVVTPPKDHRGLATLDISDPFDPVPLDFVDTDADSYIGGFYAGHAYLIRPWRTFDVLTDPTNITLLGQYDTVDTEYMSFSDGYAFVGAMRPEPGIHKWDISDPTTLAPVGKVEGRRDGIDNGFLTDDQFGLPIGNLLVMCDDETRKGCVLAVHDGPADATPPRVATSVPADGDTGVARTSRIGVALTDGIDLRSVTDDTVQLVPADGGPPVPLQFGLDQTLLHLWPEELLAADTAYEVVLAAGGITDLAGNALAAEARIAFTTGDGVAPPRCDFPTPPPVQAGVPTSWATTADDATLVWSVGEVQVEPGYVFDAPGRYAVSLTVTRAGVSRRCAATQIVHPAMPDTVSVSASTIVAAGRTAWVVNPDADSVTAIDLDGLAVRVEVPVGDDPRTVAVDATGRAWVAAYGSDEVVVVDAGGQVRRVALPWGSRPFGVAIHGDTAWVTLEGRGALVGIDTTSLQVGPWHDLGGPTMPVRGLALSPDGAHAWVTRFVSPADHGQVWVVETATGEVQGVTLQHHDAPDAQDEGRGVPNLLSHIALTPDGSRALIPGKKDNVRRGLARDGQPLNPVNTVRSMISLVDASERTEDLAARVDLDDHEGAFASVISPWGDIAFVASQGTNRIDVVDVWRGRLIGGISTGFSPMGVALTDAGLLLVQERDSRVVSVFDVTGFIDGTDSTGWRVAEVVSTETEPLSEIELLGRRLFTNANSSAMSQDGYLSCNSCHPDGGSDGRQWDFTQRGEGIRDTIDLRGKAGGHGRLHWSGNFDEVHDFEGDIRQHMGGSGLMGDEDFAATADPLGEVKAGRSERLDALAAYVATLDAFPRSPHRNADGTLTESARRGQVLFERRDCTTCHTGPDLTDSSTGVRHDVGTLTPDSGQRLGEPLDGLDTPTLFGLYATPPYLHDGSAATLVDVLNLPGHGNAQALSDADKADLVDFLLQLEPDVTVQPRGCGCAVGGPVGRPAWLAGLLLLVARRRR